MSFDEPGCTRPRRYYVLEDTGKFNEESGVFYRHYDLESYGDSLAELIDNAMIHELSVDGVQCESRGLYSYDNTLIRHCEALLCDAFLKGGNDGQR